MKNLTNFQTFESQEVAQIARQLHDIIAQYEYDQGVIDVDKAFPALCKKLGYKLSPHWNQKDLLPKEDDLIR